MKQGAGTVKSIISGDTIIIIGQPRNGGPPPEMQLTLSGIIAPRVARGPEGKEEPFGFASREYLRKLCLGKPVTFKQEYRVDSIGKDFGSIFGGGNSLAKSIVAAGYATVKSLDGKDPASEDYEELVKLQEKAKGSKLGMWCDDKSSGTRIVKWAGSYDTAVLMEACKDTPQPAVVEQLRDGASLRCYLFNHGVVVNVNLSGLRCARVGGETEVPEPFSREALLFSELRMLQRDVLLHLEGLDKTGNFFGTVEHPKGNLGVELLKAGLAKMVDWSANFTSRKNQALLRAAETEAKEANLKMWASYAPPVISGARNFTGKVLEVCSADTLLIAMGEDGSGATGRLTLSSIKVPRSNKETQEPFAEEAFEALRAMAIGKRVTVSIEYKKDPPADSKFTEERKFGTLIIEGKKSNTNAALELIKKGLAECVRHRNDDERSKHYDALLQAEDEAKLKLVGKWSTKVTTPTRLVDLSSDTKIAKDHFPFLQRLKNLKGIVNYCFTGSRFLITIPSENCKIMVAVCGIKAPVPARPQRGTQKATPAEPFSAESLKFSHFYLMQREVEVIVESMDTRGTIIGSIKYKDKGNKYDLAEKLLERGLATLVPYSAEGLENRNVLKSCEEAARENKIGLWLNYVEPKEEGVEESSSTVGGVVARLQKLRVSYVVSGSIFFVQSMENTNFDTVDAMMRDFTLKVNSGAASNALEVKKNLLCAVKIKDGSTTGIWIRGKIVQLQRESNELKVHVNLIDYGSVEIVGVSDIRPLDPSYFKIPSCAQESILAMIKVAKDETDEGYNAKLLLKEMSYDKTLVAKIHKRDRDGRLVLSLYDPEDPDKMSINEHQVYNGFARVAKKADLEFPSESVMLNSLRLSQEEAKASRVGIFQYGDTGDSDDDKDFGWNKAPAVKR